MSTKTPVRFFYLRDNNGMPVVCIAVNFDKQSKRVAYGVSTLHPSDHCIKRIARKLAVGDMMLKRKVINLWAPSMKESEITCHYINRRVLEDMLMLEKEELPNRARKLATKWLDKALEFEMIAEKHSSKDGYVPMDQVLFNETLWHNPNE